MTTTHAKSQCDNDWREFVESVARLHRPKMGATELTKHYRGTTVTWQGEVQNVYLDEPEIFSYLAMSMPCHELRLSEDKVLRARRVTMSIAADKVDVWAKCNVGESIVIRGILDFWGHMEGGIVSPSHDDDLNVAPSVSVYEPDYASQYNDLQISLINPLLVS